MPWALIGATGSFIEAAPDGRGRDERSPSTLLSATHLALGRGDHRGKARSLGAGWDAITPAAGSERTGNSKNAEIEAVATVGSGAGILGLVLRNGAIAKAPGIGTTQAPPSPAVQTICCAI
jgi:hypothetical protein